VREGTVGS
jgi:cAMP-dependent protein kinase regulator